MIRFQKFGSTADSVVGQAIFNPSGGTIAGLAQGGAILGNGGPNDPGIVYGVTGEYAVLLNPSIADALYTVSVTCDPTTYVVAKISGKTAAGFTILVATILGVPFDPALIDVTIFARSDLAFIP